MDRQYEPRAARNLFDQAYTDYLQTIRLVWADYLESCQQSCRSYVGALERMTTDSTKQHRQAQEDYHAALLGDYHTREQCSEAAYDRYMRAILKAWDFEKALQQSRCALEAYREALNQEALNNCDAATNMEQAQSAYRQQLKLSWTPEITASCRETYDEHVQMLANAWMVAQRRIAQAHRDYVQAVQQIWTTIDTSDIDDDCLAEIAKSMTSVALHPAPWPASVPELPKWQVKNKEA